MIDVYFMKFDSRKIEKRAIGLPRPARGRKTIYVDLGLFSEFQAAGETSASRLIEEFMREFLKSKTEGGADDTQRD